MSGKTDFSWYEGEVDHDAVMQIVNLKRRQQIIDSYRGKVSAKDLKLIDSLSTNLGGQVLKDLYEQLNGKE